jgi:hypothetical protein
MTRYRVIDKPFYDNVQLHAVGSTVDWNGPPSKSLEPVGSARRSATEAPVWVEPIGVPGKSSPAASLPPANDPAESRPDANLPAPAEAGAGEARPGSPPTTAGPAKRNRKSSVDGKSAPQARAGSELDHDPGRKAGG